MLHQLALSRVAATTTVTDELLRMKPILHFI
jgi:hypothetical protein